MAFLARLDKSCWRELSVFVTPEFASITVDFAQWEKTLSMSLKPDPDLVKLCLQKHICPHGCISRLAEIQHSAGAAVAVETHMKSTESDIYMGCTKACTADNVLQQPQTQHAHG